MISRKRSRIYKGGSYCLGSFTDLCAVPATLRSTSEAAGRRDLGGDPMVILMGQAICSLP